jgi:hypothetical protein
MPGSYAHITLVNEASEKRSLNRIVGFPREAIEAANLHVNFLELGCVSPDYPYLDLTSGDSRKWANAMHYTHTCQAICVGAELVRRLPPGLSKEKCLAWLTGYTAHVVADMCIHPVVELKVGRYNKAHATAHRRCEMHQDVYIFRRMGLGMPQTANHMKATILSCGASDDPKQLDRDVKKLWEELLKKVHPKAFTDDPPDMDKWHRRCYKILEKLLPTSSRFVGFARHVCNGFGVLYPSPDEIDRKEYIENLRVPAPKGIDRRQQYDDIFNFAIKRVQQVWFDVTRYALGYGDLIAFRNQEWNLDNGLNELAEGEGPVFWKEA